MVSRYIQPSGAHRISIDVNLAITFPGPAQTPAHEISPGRIRAELDRIQSSKLFASSPRLSQLLLYLVRAVQSGSHETIKEYILALDVFGRSAEFDPGTSSIVRVHLGRLRAKLASYYASEGIDSELMIVLPKGSCCPIFIRRHNAV
jgi:hypothetical protein